MRSCTITIDPDAIRHNVDAIKSHLNPTTRLLAMVKADGYGHGATTIAPLLVGADALGVATLAEALQLRQATDKPIVIIEGVFSLDEWHLALEQGFSMLIHHEQQLTWALNHPPKPSPSDRPAPNQHTIWLKCNTGMNRLGFDQAATIAAAPQLAKHYQIILTSHFACADVASHLLNARQIQLFDETLTAIRAQCPSIQASLCNSAGIVNFPHCHHDWVRAGIALYGASPVSHLSATALNLRPVMTFSAKVMAIHNIDPEQTVGYGGLWTAHKPSRIGVVSAGYGDGYPRVISNGTACVSLSVQGQPHQAIAPIIGRVAMDMLVIDLSDLPFVELNADVILWGDKPHIDDVAHSASTISYELMCRLTTRPVRTLKASSTKLT